MNCHNGCFQSGRHGARGTARFGEWSHPNAMATENSMAGTTRCRDKAGLAGAGMIWVSATPTDRERIPIRPFVRAILANLVFRKQPLENP